MKTMITLFVVFFSLMAGANAATVKVYFNNEEINKVIEMYSKATGQKFIIDPGVRGRISIYNQEPITHEEFFSQLSNALSLNGFAISKQEDVMVIQSARNAQRNLLEVSAEVPPIKPQKMYTWIYTAKHVPVSRLNRDLRILPSKDGEMNINEPTNQIIISDWSTNIVRVAEILKSVDIPQDPNIKKMIQKAQVEMPPRKGLGKEKSKDQ